MKKIETLFVGAVLVGAVAMVGGAIWRAGTVGMARGPIVGTSKYGDFLAAQHALHVNDFDRAADFAANISPEYPVSLNTKMLADFLSGRMPTDAALLEKETALHATLIYDTYLIINERWGDFYTRHKSDVGVLTAPLRIWSAVASGHADEALKWIEKLPTTESWRNFVRGQIYAEQGNIKKAAEEFNQVLPAFMNIGDYMLMMSFYRAHDMNDMAEMLRTEFTGQPGGMFVMDYDDIPDWSTYSGYKNALGFSLMQNVSHTQIMMYSDLSIIMLRMAGLIAPGAVANRDAINYYTGQYFFNNGGDYARYFDRISRTSPFYPFARLRVAQSAGDIGAIRDILREYPLFVPAVNYMIGHYISNGERRAALRVINKVLDEKRLTDATHAFSLKSRAHVHFMFGDYDAAAADLHAAADILVADPEILSLQARIWAAQGREIENAYEYAMTLVRRTPADIMAWDTLGRVVAVREGTDAALDVLDRVGDIATTYSPLFEQLGDLWAKKGEYTRARAAYERAIELSDDGLVVVPNIKKKLRKLK